MQPIAYFAIRSLLGWLQFVERGERAFVNSTAMLVATGAAHCWAVVYALFIAIHTRAMRFDGYHDGYTEHLPMWVSSTETLAVGSMSVWWAAGFLTAAIRIVDDDANELPVDERDVNIGFFMRAIRSSRLHEGLCVAHTLSCVGLFASIILLCFAMALMKGVVTAAEIGLCLVSIGFALPHAVVAYRQLQVPNPKKEDDAAAEPTPAAEAAAQEAASLGPQLCIILALADSPGHAYLWQNVAYIATALVFVAAVAACGQAPPKVSRVALPPASIEFFVCICLNLAASASLVMCFPHLNTWYLWALTFLLFGLGFAIWLDACRDVLVDLIDPLLVVRSDADQVLPGKQREQLRSVNRVVAVICAAIALWDILLHPLPEGLMEPPSEQHVGSDLPELWDPSSMMLLRWLPELEHVPGEQELLADVADALALESSLVATQVFAPSHRLLLFKAKSPGVPAHARWKAAKLSPTEKLAPLLDADFPAALNVTLCLHAHAAVEHAKADGKHPVMPAEFADAVGSGKDVREAYMVGCEWWTRALDAHYSSEREAKNRELQPSGTAEGSEPHTEGAPDLKD